MNTSEGPRAGLFLKLMAAFLIVVLTVGILVPWLAGRAARQEYYLFTSTVGQRQAEKLAPLLADHHQEHGGWDNLESALSFQRPGWAGRRPGMDPGPMPGMWRAIGPGVLIADAGGHVVANSSGELVGSSVDPDNLAAGAPIWVDGDLVGTVLVTSGEISSTVNDQFVQRVSNAVWLAALVAGAVALLLGGLITWGVTRPVRALTQAAEAIAAGDLSQRVSAGSSDEVGDLAEAFNRMAGELERGEMLRRQMTADIAHELRTPLSVIQGNVEALQDGVFALTVEALEPIQAKTDLLARLVEDLRNLALAEAGQLPLDRQPTDLAALAQRTATGFNATAEVKSIALEVTSEPDLPPADADPQRVEQVLVNLLSNALRHTPAGGRVHIQLFSADPQHVAVRVTDTGPGIPAEAQPNVFERFYRVDQGRARGDGSGLGLAVARSIIQAHGGTIDVESLPGKGASFRFTLPAVS